MSGTFTWRKPAAIGWVTVALLVSLGAIAHFPKVFLWLCLAGAASMSASWDAVRARAGRSFPYFAHWNWIEGLLAIAGCALMVGSCIGMLTVSLSSR